MWWMPLIFRDRDNEYLKCYTFIKIGGTKDTTAKCILCPYYRKCKDYVIRCKTDNGCKD